MEKMFVFSQTCVIFFLLVWSMSKCQDTYQRCPADINGGYIITNYLERHCEGLPGHVCDYECNPGFTKVDYKLYCQVDGVWHSVWHPDSKTFCAKVLCPEDIDGVYLESSCNRFPGYECFYGCKPGFVKKYNSLTCGENGKWIQDTNSVCIKKLCPSEFYGGYIDLLCNTACGSTCTFFCKTGFYNNRHSSWLTCGETGEWSPDINSSCLKSVESRSALTVLRSTDEGNIITIMGITAGSLIGMIIIVAFVVWIAKRGRKSQRRVPSQAVLSCLRQREYHVHDVTNIRQQPNANGIGSVSSVESPSYNGLYVNSFVQRIPTISSSCKYPEPPPSYSETPIAPNESPPTYEEVVTDPSRFILNI